MTDHWAVTVWRNGEQVVTIESNSLSGMTIGPDEERVIRNAAEHLLAFIGDTPKFDPAGAPLTRSKLQAMAEIVATLLPIGATTNAQEAMLHYIRTLEGAARRAAGKDAERYSWLKKNASMTLGTSDGFIAWEAGRHSPWDLDEMIDAQIAAEGKAPDA